VYKLLNGGRSTVEVQIPRGVWPNSSIKYPGLGDNFFESLARGDLYVRIHIENNSGFHIEGLDLVKVIDINCLHAIIGHTVIVEGLDGKTIRNDNTSWHTTWYKYLELPIKDFMK